MIPLTLSKPSVNYKIYIILHFYKLKQESLFRLKRAFSFVDPGIQQSALIKYRSFLMFW